MSALNLNGFACPPTELCGNGALHAAVTSTAARPCRPASPDNRNATLVASLITASTDLDIPQNPEGMQYEE